LAQICGILSFFEIFKWVPIGAAGQFRISARTVFGQAAHGRKPHIRIRDLLLRKRLATVSVPVVAKVTSG
jgi:hypothetical protein